MHNQVLCQDCLAVKPYTDARHLGDDKCECGGDFCGCSDCSNQAYQSQIPKQVAKAPKLGAAVSSMPLHDVTIPLDKPVTADFMAQHALDEWHRSMELVRHHQRLGDKEASAFFLNDAAEFRRIYVAFRRAVTEMGGL